MPPFILSKKGINGRAAPSNQDASSLNFWNACSLERPKDLCKNIGMQKNFKHFMHSSFLEVSNVFYLSCYFYFFLSTVSSCTHILWTILVSIHQVPIEKKKNRPTNHVWRVLVRSKQRVHLFFYLTSLACNLWKPLPPLSALPPWEHSPSQSCHYANRGSAANPTSTAVQQTQYGQCL